MHHPGTQKRGVCKNPAPDAAFMLALVAWLFGFLVLVGCCFAFVGYVRVLSLERARRTPPRL